MQNMKLFFVLCVAAWSSAKQLSCPYEEDIKPCTCTLGPTVTCEGLKSVKVLRQAIAGMKNSQISSFFLTQSQIGVLPADIFANMDIRVLNMKFNNMTSLSESIHRPPFLGLENKLEYLMIRDTFLDKPLNRLSLSHLKKLVLLQLEGNLIPTLGNDWFESGPYGLKELQLLETRTKSIGSHVFAFFNNMRKLSLTGGHLSTLSRRMLPSSAPTLQSLSFSNNKIESLPVNFFSKMPALKEIFLENNQLKTVDEMLFAPVWSQLSHVYFYGNPLVCDLNIKWIYKYRLPQTLQGHCAFPQKLQYRSLNQITLADLE